MPWSGSAGSQTFSRSNGTNSGATTWAQDEAAAVGITTARHDIHDEDIADSLNLALKKDGGNTATADIPMGGFKFTNLADGTSAAHAATVGQTETLVRDRGTVRVATTANITIATALNNGDTLDGVTLATDDLVLVKDQSAPAENGVYRVAASPARDTAYDAWNDLPGLLISVREGTAGADTLWLCTANRGGTIDTTSLTFTQKDAFNQAAAIISGTLTLTGTISPTQLAANTNNWAPTDLATAAVIRLTTNAGRDLTGLTGGVAGRVIVLHNVGSNSLFLKDEDTNSTDVNRFALPGSSVNFTLGADMSCILQYDGTTQRWRFVGAGIGKANQSLMEAASNDSVYISPGVMHYHPGVAKFWVQATTPAGVPTIQSSYNVTSVADPGAGGMTVTIATDFSSANWCAWALAQEDSSGTGLYASQANGALAAGTIGVVAEDASGTLVDPDCWHVGGFGDHA